MGLQCLFMGGHRMVGGAGDGTVYCMSIRQRFFLVFKFIAKVINDLMCNILMLVDDVFFPEYRATDLSESVFIVGSFRTGSTSLHRYLSMDSDRYTSPLYFELFFPFLCLWRLKELVDRTFGHERTGPVYAR